MAHPISDMLSNISLNGTRLTC